MNRIDRVAPSGIRKVFDRALSLEASGQRIVHFEIGRPDNISPRVALDGAENALREGKVHYSTNAGILPLRTAIAEQIALQTGVLFDPETEIIISAGSSQALSALCCALIDPGDEVIIPLPAWPHYAACVQISDGIPVFIHREFTRNFQWNPDQIAKRITKRTKIIVLNSPCNPTGAVASLEAIREISAICQKNGILLLSDEVYDNFVFKPSQHSSALSLPNAKEYCVYMNSFSKSYSMTGWRLGIVACRKELAERILKAQQYSVVCANTFAQYGALSLLLSKEAVQFRSDMNQEYSERFRTMYEQLSTIPSIKLASTSGAMYLFPQIEFQEMNDYQLSTYLIEKAGVATVPGSVFGDVYNRFLRLAFTVSEAEIKLGAEKMRAALA